MLSMMIRTYRNLPQKELDQRQFATVETRKRQLIEAYVQRQFRLVFQGGPGA